MSRLAAWFRRHQIRSLRANLDREYQLRAEVDHAVTWLERRIRELEDADVPAWVPGAEYPAGARVRLPSGDVVTLAATSHRRPA